MCSWSIQREGGHPHAWVVAVAEELGQGRKKREREGGSERKKEDTGFQGSPLLQSISIYGEGL